MSILSIEKASIITAMRGPRGRPVGINGLVIEFTSVANVQVDAIYLLKIDGDNYYFRVRELATNGEALTLKAVEYGYWAAYTV